MAIRIDVGDKLYLHAQLIDKDASLPKRVIADILNSSGALITNVELTYVSDGVFYNTSYVMPSQPVVFVKYYVYESDGVTLSSIHGFAEERYVSSKLTAMIYGGEIQGIVYADSELEGFVSNSVDLYGTVADIQLIGTVYVNDKIEGAIYE